MANLTAHSFFGMKVTNMCQDPNIQCGIAVLVAVKEYDSRSPNRAIAEQLPAVCCASITSCVCSDSEAMERLAETCSLVCHPALLDIWREQGQSWGPVWSGALFGAGWWFWVDAVACSPAKIPFVQVSVFLADNCHMECWL